MASSTPTEHCSVVASSVQTTVHWRDVEEGRTPDGERENIDKVLKANPVHQLSRWRVVEVVVGKGDSKAKQNGENHHKHQQDKNPG